MKTCEKRLKCWEFKALNLNKTVDNTSCVVELLFLSTSHIYNLQEIFLLNRKGYLANKREKVTNIIQYISGTRRRRHPIFVIITFIIAIIFPFGSDNVLYFRSKALSKREAHIRAKFESSEDLVHRLFVCIAGVADQLQVCSLLFG